ncbi:MAG: PolC-type DNA polymerase III [bacterium]
MDAFTKFLEKYKFSNIELVNIKINKTKKFWDLYLKIDNVLEIAEFKRLKNSIADFFYLENIDILFNITYKKKATAEQIKNYYSYMMKDYIVDYRFLTFSSNRFEVENDIINVFLEKINKEHTTLTEDIEVLMNRYGIDIKIKLNVDTNLDVQKLQEEARQQSIKKQMEDMTKNRNIEAPVEIKTERTNYKKSMNSAPIPISEVPTTQEELDIYRNTVGSLDFVVEGNPIKIDIRELRNNNNLLEMIVKDDSGLLIAKLFFKDDKTRDLLDQIKKNTLVKLVGFAAYDNYTKDVVLNIKDMKLAGEKKVVHREDLALEKRVELHCHTKMSTLDAITSAKDYIEEAARMGHKAIAITDHDGVYAIPEIYKACKKHKIKPIYGLETGLIDEKNFKIAYTDHNIELKDATYVVFDIETTGFSTEFDDIIEIGAVKIKNGIVQESFSEIIDPQRTVSEFIKNLTNITDEMIKGSRTISEVLPDFIKFCGDGIMVAQNASFDIGHMYANMDKLNIKNPNWPVIDTMQFARNFYHNEIKTFNLKSLSKFFKVKQESHHRADDDARVTGEIFVQMLQKLADIKVTNYNQINDHIDTVNAYKFGFTKHVTLLVKNQVGYKNLFKIVSDLLTKHFYKEGRLLKSVLEAHREGILVGTSCCNGEVFDTALNKPYSQLIECMKYYDYVELQPPSAYRHLEEKLELKDVAIKETMKKIIKAAQELNKIIVATGDAHYLTPDLAQYYDIFTKVVKPSGQRHTLGGYKTRPDLHFRTTDNMLAEFKFLGANFAHEIVVQNTNKIADMIEEVQAFKPNLFSPVDNEFKDSLNVASIEGELKRLVYEKAYELYGKELPKFVVDRIDKELNSIISNKFSPVYYMSHLLVKKSLDDNYLVGSRGSVGSSLVATLMDITEVNPLAPHYTCPNGDFTVFKLKPHEVEIYGITKEQKKFQDDLNAAQSGYDLPIRECPHCKAKMLRDGQDIPFETFLGFKGDKVPDIDLNFSGKYQPVAHEYVKTLMGEKYAFRAGTISTVAFKTAIGYVKGYLEDNGITKRSIEIPIMAQNIEGVKRSTGQHPGGIVVVPSNIEINDITPIQYPADKTDSPWLTTHFDYHSFEDNLLKLDILGHDDPTTIRYLFDYVWAHPDEFPFSDPRDVPVDDPEVYKMFSGTSVLKIKPSDIDSEVATFAIPEFGTDFTRRMLLDTKPKTFADLVKISGLSHGTNVWTTNAQELVLGNTEHGKIPFEEVIGCRDDIMEYLMTKGVDPKIAFDIMEYVRKGKAATNSDPAKWKEFTDILRETKIPEWYIWSCEKIAYMFPKAHAVAYVLMAIRIAWFKIHKPKLFYSAFFSIRATQFDPQAMLMGENAIRSKIRELDGIIKGEGNVKEKDLRTCLKVALEMIVRGYKFLPVDINMSLASDFALEEDGLRMPFSSMDGLGENVALGVIEARKEKAFTSKEDVKNRTKINKNVFIQMDALGAFGDLKEEEDVEDIGLFAL